MVSAFRVATSYELFATKRCCKLYDLFELYTERITGTRYNEEDDNPLIAAVDALAYQLKQDSVRFYYAPFYLTKALQYLCFSDEGKQYLSIGMLDDGTKLNQTMVYE